MNISIAEKSDVALRIDLTVSKEDYEPGVVKRLKQLKETVSVPGFRKGHVPEGMLRKMYGANVKDEVVRDLIVRKLYEYLEEQKIEMLGHPIQTEESVAAADIDKEEITVSYDIALAPKVDTFVAKEQVTFDRYKIEVSDKEVDDMLEQMRASAMEMQEVDEVTDDALVRGELTELEGDLPKEGGYHSTAGALLIPSYIKDEEEKAKFVGAAKGDVVLFSPFKAYRGELSEIASFMSISKEEAEQYRDATFSLRIESIRKSVKPELTLEFVKKFYPDQDFADLDAAKAFIKERMAENKEGDVNYKVLEQLKDYVRTNELSKVHLDETLVAKIFAMSREEDKSEAQQAEPDHDKMIGEIKEYIYFDAWEKQLGITVEEDEIRNFAHNLAMQPFLSNGMFDPSNDFVAQYVQSYMERILKDKNMVSNISRSLSEQKLVRKLIQDDVIRVEDKAISLSDFNKLGESGEPQGGSEEETKGAE